jgi:hypothetical protein
LRPLSSDEPVPTPTNQVLIQLATLAAHVQDMLAADHPVDRTPVGLTTAKNQRRRAMETILVLLADPAVRDYVSKLERIGLVTIKR